jgi:hypothetical protein
MVSHLSFLPSNLEEEIADSESALTAVTDKKRTFQITCNKVTGDREAHTVTK